VSLPFLWHFLQSAIPCAVQQNAGYNIYKYRASFWPVSPSWDRLCGLMVRVPGYRSRGLGFNSRHYQISWEVVGLEQGLLSLVSTTEELLGRKSSDSDIENREYGRRDPLCWPCDTLYPQKVGTNFADGRRSLCQYSSLSDWGHGLCFLFCLLVGGGELQCHLVLKEIV
jgi:hypothetical protein